MNDLQLIALVAETDRCPAHAPLPEEIAGVDESFSNVVAWLDGDTAQARPRPLADDPGNAFGRRTRSAVLVMLAAFLLVIAAGAALLTLSRQQGNGPAVTPSTEAPQTVQTSTSVPTTDELIPPSSPAGDVAIAEEAVAAWYANDFETISRLLDMPGGSTHRDWTPDDFRTQMAYDSVVDARVDGLDCTMPTEATAGWFSCGMRLRNAFTDAIGLTTGEAPRDESRMRVVDGKLTRYQFHDHEFVIESFGVYLAVAGQLAGFEDCFAGTPLSADCAQIQLEHVDEWAAWNATSTPVDLAQTYLGALFDGDCAAVSALTDPKASDCDPAVLYEAAVGGALDVTNCESSASEEGRGVVVRCDGVYSNALNAAVGAPAASVPVEVSVVRHLRAWLGVSLDSPHPQDETLLESFRGWAHEAGRGDEVGKLCGLVTHWKTPLCSTFLLDNIDDWATWYSASG